MSIHSNKSLQAEVYTAPNTGRLSSYEPTNLTYAVNFIDSLLSNVTTTSNVPAGALYNANNMIVEFTAKSSHFGNGVTLKALGEIRQSDVLRYTFYFNGSSSGTIQVHDGTSFLSFGSTPTDGEWHHYRFVFVSGTLECFVDKVSRGTQAYVANTFTAAVAPTIGMTSAGQYLRCQMDYFAITTNGAKLIEYQFNAGSGTSIIDTSGNSRTGTFNNPPPESWRYNRARQTAQQLAYASNNSLIVSDGVHLIDGATLEISGGDKFSGTNKAKTIVRMARDYSGRRPVLDAPLNLTMSNSLAKDWSINNMTGSPSNVIIPAHNVKDGPSTRLNRYVHFDASTSGQISFTNHANVNGLGPFACEWWSRTATNYNPGTNRYIATKANSSFLTEWEVSVDGAFQPFITTRQGAGFHQVFSSTASSVLRNGSWHHCVMNVSLSGMELYIDSNSVFSGVWTVGTATWTPASNTDPIILNSRIGASGTYATYDLCGFRLYNFLLTPEEVSQRYRSTQDQVISSYNIGSLNKTNAQFTTSGVPTELTISDMTIHGNGANVDAVSGDYNKPYVVHGIDLFSNGYTIDNVKIYKVEGAAIYSDIGSTGLTGQVSLADISETRIKNIEINKCYAGIVLEDHSGVNLNNITAVSCRDFGIDTRNSTFIKMDDIKCVDSTVGVRIGSNGPAFCGKIETQNCNVGMVVGSGHNTTIEHFIARKSNFYGLDALGKVECSLANITVPASNANNTGVFTPSYIPVVPPDSYLPTNYYNMASEAGGPIGIRLQDSSSGSRFTNFLIANESATGSASPPTRGMEIRGGQNFINGRIQNLDIGLTLNGANANNNNIEISLENCQTGFVATTVCSTAVGNEILIYYKGIPNGVINAYIDQTPSSGFTASNNITLVPIN